jgi:hypothetical protein
VPLLALLALLGSLTPSMANISRPMSPMAVADEQDFLEQRPDLAPRVLTKAAKVVKCGALSPESAMKVTWSRQARSMSRELTMPRL